MICRFLARNLSSSATMIKNASVVADLKQIFAAGVKVAQPETAFRENRCLEVLGNSLFVRGNDGPHKFSLEDKRIHVVGFGKAVLGMAVEVEQALGEKVASGIISIPSGSLEGSGRLRVIETLEGARNNLPDEASFGASKKIVEKCKSLTKEDILVCLISGGGSALLPYPKSPLTLEQKTAMIKTLANRGATIQELNTVRIALSEVKGGRLAAYASGAYLVISLIMSDIVGDPLSLIGSGPTVCEETSENALDILEKYEIEDRQVREICSKHSPITSLPNVHNFLLFNNEIATRRAVEESRSLGYEAFCVSRFVTGDVRDVLRNLVALAKGSCPPAFDLDPKIFELKDTSKGLCLVFGGEPTVTVSGGGKGGRNQELALRFAIECRREGIRNAFLLAGGTDGIDGPTEAAGAIGCFDVAIAGEAERYLETSDSYHFFMRHNPSHHLITGHTGTNVMDLHILLLKKPGEE